MIAISRANIPIDAPIATLAPVDNPEPLDPSDAAGPPDPSEALEVELGMEV